MKNWIEISAPRLAANYATLRQSAGKGVSVLAVIKADAYGHNAALCARVLAHAGAGWLGVTDVSEAIEVQVELVKAGIPPEDQPRILIMSGSLSDEAELIVEQQLVPVVWTVAELEGLYRAAIARNRKLDVHVEVDTGMSRQGCAVGEELSAMLHWFTAQNVIQLDGIMTHFASAEVAGSHQNAAQQRAFEQAVAQVQASGLQPDWVHVGNSSAIDNLHPASSALPQCHSERAQRTEEPPAFCSNWHEC